MKDRISNRNRSGDTARLCRVRACSKPLRHGGKHGPISRVDLHMFLGGDPPTDDEIRRWHGRYRTW